MPRTRTYHVSTLKTLEVSATVRATDPDEAAHAVLNGDVTTTDGDIEDWEVIEVREV